MGEVAAIRGGDGTTVRVRLAEPSLLGKRRAIGRQRRKNRERCVRDNCGAIKEGATRKVAGVRGENGRPFGACDGCVDVRGLELKDGHPGRRRVRCYGSGRDSEGRSDGCRCPLDVGQQADNSHEQKGSR
jgi:hypothetical protein